MLIHWKVLNYEYLFESAKENLLFQERRLNYKPSTFSLRTLRLCVKSTMFFES